MNTFLRNIENLLKPGARVLLIANNPALSYRDIHTLGIALPDVVVQFNLCIHAKYFSNVTAKKIFVFSYNHLNSAFGFSPEGEPEGEVKRMLEQGEPIDALGITNGEPPLVMAQLSRYNLNIQPGVIRVDDIPGFTYPKALQPSVGYLMFSAIESLLTCNENRLKGSVFIYCIGFSGREYMPHERAFHDFTFERAMILRSPSTILHHSFV
jgi:hypothetical protein